MSYDHTSTSTSVHIRAGSKVSMEFNDFTDPVLSAVPFRTLQLNAGDHTVSVFFKEWEDGPNLADVLRQIIESATAQLEELSSTAWVNAINEIPLEVK
jgi:hypothetical protein